MNFVDLSTLNITTKLDVLERDTQRYSLFLYQHTGVFFADDTRIGNNNQQEAETKFINLLTKAVQENISLVVAPEYSCPKSVVDLILNDENLQPPKNKVWAIGGESLDKEQLDSLKELNNQNIYIHFEDIYKNSDKNYVDPLYYIFRGQHDGVDKLIILIQFKSRHMGGLWSSQLEPNNLIEGENIYILKNDLNSVRLMSFICSQAINFNATYEQHLIDNHSWTDAPFLILNLQFNPNPSHEDFIAFKKYALKRDKRELISLNWGKETTYVNGRNLYEATNTPRSGIYFKTSDIDLDYTTTKIINNHNKGLYFLQILRNKRVLFFNGNIELFKIENKSVSIVDGEDVQQRREGPTVINIFNYDEDLNFIEEEKVGDNHIDFLTSRGISNAYLLNEENSIVDKERLINISVGKVKGKEENKWADVIHLNSFGLNEVDECNNRLTYIEDTYASSEVVRTISCSNIFELDVNIINNIHNYPHSIRHLTNKNISLAFAQNASMFNYKYNLTNDNGGIEKATVCYIGNAVPLQLVKKTYDELQKLFDNDSPGKNTIVVFYKIGNDVLNKSNPDAGNITQISNDDSSII
ncbi:MAG: hypothetical protein ABIP27_04545 [Flavobacterium circumlabens]|uniref:hypothetical protein n=1 Tax=Flavobacterium circumlabens TaxID=2133765 RepID=UPI003267A6EF